MLLELTSNFLSHVPLHQVVVILERSEFSIGHIKLVDHLVALGTHLSVHNHIDVPEELFALGAEVDNLHLFQVDDVPVLVCHDLACFCALPKRFFTILKRLFAEDRNAFVEVLHGEDDSRTACESVDLCATVPQTGQELLDEAYLVNYVQMA